VWFGKERKEVIGLSFSPPSIQHFPLFNRSKLKASMSKSKSTSKFTSNSNSSRKSKSKSSFSSHSNQPLTSKKRKTAKARDVSAREGLDDDFTAERLRGVAPESVNTDGKKEGSRIEKDGKVSKDFSN